MPLALIVSSHVAGSRVGGFPQALVMAAHGVDPVLAPTVAFGRRPGLGGPPGGGALSAELLRGVLAGVEAHGLFGLTDAVVTGYFADAGQVEAAARAIEAIRTADRTGAWNPRPLIVVDPILGDVPEGLYVKPEVADAIARRLVPLADVLTPNLWELGWLSGGPCDDLPALVAAARDLGHPTLVTSAPGDSPEEIAAVWVEGATVRRFSHRRFPGVPNGTGDLVAAVLAAAAVNRKPLADAAELAVHVAAEAVSAAAEWRAPELPLVALGRRVVEPTAEVRVERLDGW